MASQGVEKGPQGSRWFGVLGSDRLNDGTIAMLERVASNVLLAAVALGIPLSALLIIVAAVVAPTGGYVPIDAFARFILPATAAMLTVDFGLKAARMISSNRLDTFRRTVLSAVAAVCIFSAEGLREGYAHERQLQSEVAADNARSDYPGQVEQATEQASRLLAGIDDPKSGLSPESRELLRLRILDSSFGQPTVSPTETPPSEWLVALEWIAPFVLSVSALLLLLGNSGQRRGKGPDVSADQAKAT